MSDTEHTLKQIETLSPLYEAFWEKICSFETPSDDKTALDMQTAYIADFARGRGFFVTEYPFERAGNCLVVQTKREERAKIVFLAHLDTVHPAGCFGDTPVRREGDRLTGPGVIDCKGGAAVALLAAEALMRADGPVPPVKVILTTDEEVNARYSGEAGLAFIRDQARGAAAAFNCETGRDGLLTVGRKGVLQLRIDIRGRAAHAGNGYFSGASAVKEAAYKILALEALSSPDGATFNCGVISGGTRSNIVPADCRVEVDVRGATEEALRRARGKVEEIAEHAFVPGTSAAVQVVSHRPPMEHVPATDRLFEAVRAASRKFALEEVSPIEKGGGSDSAYLIGIGIPTICSIGPTGTGEHTTEETAWIPSLQGRAKLLAASVIEVAAGSGV